MDIDLASTSKDLISMLYEKHNEVKETLAGSCIESNKYQHEEKLIPTAFPRPYSQVARSKLMAKQSSKSSDNPIKVKVHSYSMQQPPNIKIERYKASNYESPINNVSTTSSSERSSTSFSNHSSSMSSPHSHRQSQKCAQSVHFSDDISESSPRPRLSAFLERNSCGRLLQDDGNMRPAADQSVALWGDASDSRPRVARRHRLHSILARSAILRKSPPSRRIESSRGDYFDDNFSSTPPRINSSKSDSSTVGGDYRRLGYDWIASMLENSEGTALDQSDEFYENLSTFRKQHKDECYSKNYRDEAFKLANQLTSTDFGPKPRRVHLSELEEVRELEEPVYAFTVNDRLFAVPMDEDSAALASVADISEPKIVKVSVPLSRLRCQLSKHQPDRKRILECDPDSASLTSHCQIGFNQPLSAGHAPSISKTWAEPADLKAFSGLTGVFKQQPRTEAEAIAQLKRGSKGARRQIVSQSGELPIPDELLLDSAGGEGTISALVSKHQIADSKSQTLRNRVHATQSRLQEAYSAALRLKDSS